VSWPPHASGETAPPYRGARPPQFPCDWPASAAPSTGSTGMAA